MKNLKLIALTLILTGCINTKLVPQYIFPSPPANLMVAPKPLNQILEPKKLDGVDLNAAGP